jgi:hypothetical protein
MIKQGAYADALPELQKMATATNLTAEQKQALQDLIAKVQTLATGRKL